MRKRAAIYARVSCDEQTKGFSIQTQLVNMRDYAESQGFKVSIEHEFQEDFTGIKLDRPELNKVRALIKHGEIDALIVYAADRLTRNPIHGPILRDELIEAGIELHFVTRGKVENTPEGEILAAIEDQFSHYWWSSMQEAAVRGRRGKAEAGVIPGSGALPYGYIKEGKRRDMRLVVQPEQAKVVHYIFTWFVQEDLSVAVITERLTTLNIVSPGGANHGNKRTGLCEWSASTVGKMLRQETYAGTLYAYKYRKLKDRKGSVLRPREEWIPIQVPAIVERELWEAAQQKLDERRQTYIKPPRYDYLMSRRIKCTCGRHASGRPHYWKNLVYQYYHCNDNSRKRLCKMRRFRADVVDTMVWQWVVNLVNAPHTLAGRYREAQHQLDQQHVALKEQIEAIDRQIDKQQQKLEQLLDLYLDGAFPKGVLDQKRKEIEHLLASLDEERKKLEQQLSVVTITDEHVQAVETLVASVGGNLEGTHFILRRQLVEALNLSVTLGVEDGAQIIYLQWTIHTERLCIKK